jgi:hypothetical protein
VQPHLQTLRRLLSRDYGGMQHQERESEARSARQSGLPMPTRPDPTGVEHFSVRPDYAQAAATPLEEPLASVIGLIRPWSGAMR